MERVITMSSPVVNNPGVSRTPRKQKYDSAAHAIREFSAGVAFMVESDDKGKVDIGTLVEKLVVALQGQTSKPSVHPLMYVNLAFVLTLAFFSGSLWTRVANVETRVQGVDLVQVVNMKVDMLQQQLRDLKEEEKRK
jgi:hypothetical protein